MLHKPEWQTSNIIYIKKKRVELKLLYICIIE